MIFPWIIHRILKIAINRKKFEITSAILIYKITRFLLFQFFFFYSNSFFYCAYTNVSLNYLQTLFVVTCNLEPGKEADFCRVGTMCQLNLEVLPYETNNFHDISLMYEVIADSTMWAVCGRAAGNELTTLAKNQVMPKWS